ncbi:MAG: carboxypeptidase-like regulatory domain-containing protein, partial [Flavobacteriales bacterium]
MKQLFTILLSLTWSISMMHGQAVNSKYTISGQIRSAQNGEFIIGALVACKDLNLGTSTNNLGFYSLTLPAGKHTIEFAMIGFESKVEEIELSGNVTRSLELDLASQTMDALVIEADKAKNTESTDVGKIELSMNQIRNLPVLLGEVDILKTITLLPGVKSSGEGNAGFYVRGGGVDQNLILLDNATVYNASHLFGFFSVFNADAVSNLEITKGGIPANYGSRLASVLDIGLKEGNQKKVQAKGG